MKHSHFEDALIAQIKEAMKESTVEEYLVKRVEQKGGLCEKFVSPGRRGVPDRLVTWRGGRMDLVELKTEDGKLSLSQVNDHRQRAARGVIVEVLRSFPEVDSFVSRKGE